MYFKMLVVALSQFVVNVAFFNNFHNLEQNHQSQLHFVTKQLSHFVINCHNESNIKPRDQYHAHATFKFARCLFYGYLYFPTPGPLFGPQPWPWSPTLVPNLYLPVLTPELFLLAVASNLCLPVLALNLYLTALAPNFCLAALDPNLYLLALASNLLFTSSGQDFTTTTTATCTINTTTIITTTTTTTTSATRDNNIKRCLRIRIKCP